jgi:hypothetical protein
MDFYTDAIRDAAEECGAELTDKQIAYLARADRASKNVGLAFNTPPASDRLSEVEGEWMRKYEALKAEYSTFQSNAERAVQESFGLRRDDRVSIGSHGRVLLNDGQGGRRIQ